MDTTSWGKPLLGFLYYRLKDHACNSQLKPSAESKFPPRENEPTLPCPTRSKQNLVRGIHLRFPLQSPQETVLWVKRFSKQRIRSFYPTADTLSAKPQGH